MTSTGLFVRITLLLILLTACNGVSSNQTQSDYDKLCKIYEEVLSKPFSPVMVGAEIGERVQKEIPAVYIHFENIANADPQKAYQLFKNVVEKETQKSWDCQIMKNFYSGKLNSQN
jgi:hypothetical protein